MTARAYQTELDLAVDKAWTAGAHNVCMRLDTGGGKTKILALKHARERAPSCVFAHRHELTSQLSLALAREGVYHKVIGAQTSVRACHQEHLAEFGTTFVNPQAPCAVASVDTLVRAAGLESWAGQVRLWTCDEAHHLVLDNKWHRAIDLFTHAEVRGLGPTATPSRADGKGLGRGHGGVFDAMVQGPPMRWLIDQGYLCDYDIACPTSDLVVLQEAGASGDWNSKQLREAAERSHIVGDVIKQYLRFARGKMGVTFSTDVDTAAEIVQAYTAAGVRAALLTGTTDPGLRRQTLRQLAARELEMLVAVDIVSEGFDLPAIEVAVFARPTQSLSLYMQQFGRALRVLFAEGFDLETQAGRLAAIAAGPKPKALIIDLVGNVLRHRVPDLPRPWTLERRGRGGGGGGIPMRICTNVLCVRPFERFYIACPYCDTPVPPPEPGSRSSPEMVDGDVALMSPDLLAALRGEIERMQRSAHELQLEAVAKYQPRAGIVRDTRLLIERQEAQAQLWDAMGAWGGSQLAAGRADREMQRLFFLSFNVDVLTARTLGPADALALRDRIRTALQ